MRELLAVGVTVIASFLGGGGSLMLKLASEYLSFNVFEQVRNWRLFVGAGLYGGASLLFIYALSLANLSLLYPITSLSYVWASLAATKVLDERMNMFKWIGVVCIIAGAFMVTV